LIVKDPATGGWINAETGNAFDLEKHLEEAPEQFKQVEEYLKNHDDLEKSGNTALQKAMVKIQKKFEEDFKSIQQEINKRRIEQLKKDMEHLEYEQKVANSQNNMGRILGDSVKNIGDELVDTTIVIGTEVGSALGELKNAAVDVWRDPSIVTKTVSKTYEDIEKSYNEAAKAINDTIDKIAKNPEVEIKRILVNAGKKTFVTVGQVGKAVVDTLRDPKKVLEMIKDSAGYNDFLKSWDPNLSLLQRLKHVGSGTFKLGMTLSGVGKMGTSLKTGLGKVTGLVDDLLVGGKNVRLPIGINPKIPTQFGPKYVTSPRVADLDGITEASKKIIQNTADDFGVQIHARPTTPLAKKLIESGQAVPKSAELKAKTLGKLDELIGGPKNSEGLVGYYKPKFPSKDLVSKLPAAEQKKLVKLFIEREKEYTKLAKDIKKLQEKGYTVVDKKVLYKGKAITGDVDIYDVTNFDGTPVSPTVKKQVLESLTKKKGSNVLHEDLVSWDKKSGTLDLKAKAKMLNAAGGNVDDAKGLTSFNPLAKPTNSVHFDTKIPVGKIDQYLKGDFEGMTRSEMAAIQELLRSSGMEG